LDNHIKDRRVQRTRKFLKEALLDLMIEKGYENITIQNIIDRANVGRSTFYSHFLDKQDLLTSSIEELSDFISIKQKENKIKPYREHFRFVFSLIMLEHADQHRQLYQALVQKKGGTQVMRQMEEMLSDVAREEIMMIAHNQLPKCIPIEIVIHFVTVSFLSVLSWWMSEQNPYTAQKADDLFHTLTLPGIYALKSSDMSL
jgi:AcrR family transcriptional regulator